jgi:glucose-1-phosphate thymidylyltransferase
MFQELFIDGEKLGLKLLYGEQPSPDGLAQSFIIGAKLMGGDDVF